MGALEVAAPVTDGVLVAVLGVETAVEEQETAVGRLVCCPVSFKLIMM